MTIAVRPIRELDAAPWASLYAGYRAFYSLPEDPSAVETTWQWVLAGEHNLFGLVAVNKDDELLGLANLRWFARPSAAAMGLYLDDLFTAPQARGLGAANALLDHAATLAGAAGASVVRWITAADNKTARGVYDKLATATHWVTYDMVPTSPTP